MTNQRLTPHPNTSSPTKIVGSILAMGVIRLIERQKDLDNLTEKRVSTGVPTTKEKTP